jgi:hypothetical protein
MPVGRKRRHQRFYVLNSEHQSYAWSAGAMPWGDVLYPTESLLHGEPGCRGSTQDWCAPWHCGSTADKRISTTDECMGSTVLRNVLTLFQNGGKEGFDIFILGVPHVAVNIPSYLRFTL